MPVQLSCETARTCGLPIVIFIALFVSGCKKAEQIQERTEPIPVYEQPYPDPQEGAKVAVIVAIAPLGRKDGLWCFFKFSGPIDAVARERKNLDEFLASLDYQPKLDVPFFWKLPAGWRWLPGGGFRLATMKTGPLPTEDLVEVTVDDPAIRIAVRAFQIAYDAQFAELSVSKAGGSILDNVNRWRKNDLGLPPLAPADLPRVLRYRDLDKATLILVDMAGPGGTKSAMPALHPPIEQ